MPQRQQNSNPPAHCGTIRSLKASSYGCKRRFLIMLAVAGVLLVISSSSGDNKPTTGKANGAMPENATLGFDLSNAVIPRDQFVRGGPGKDGIPSIDNPKFIATDKSTNELRPVERVVGVTIDNEARAYPLSILNWHECVNDTINQVPVAVTYCPLCDSVAVFDRRVEGETLAFGISGLLYNSNVLLYNRSTTHTESLWSQVRMMAVAGPLAGTTLETIPAELTSWASWRNAHPHTMVLSYDTGHHRDYNRNPYQRYLSDPGNLMFPVTAVDTRRALKDRIIGVCVKDSCKAYAERDLVGRRRITDSISGMPVTITYDRSTRTLGAADLPPDTDVVHSFWFAWAAMHPHTGIYEPDSATRSTDVLAK